MGKKKDKTGKVTIDDILKSDDESLSAFIESIKDDPELIKHVDTLLRVFPVDIDLSEFDEEYMAECCEINGHEYFVDMETDTPQGRYVALANEDDVTDIIFMRRIVDEDGDDCLEELDSEWEAEYAMIAFHRDKLIHLRNQLIQTTGSGISETGEYEDKTQSVPTPVSQSKYGVEFSNGRLLLKNLMEDDADDPADGVDPRFVLPSDEDPLYEEVKDYIREEQRASTSLLQRKFGVGYNRAARLIDSLEANGIIGPANGEKPREILCPNGDNLRCKEENDGFDYIYNEQTGEGILPRICEYDRKKLESMGFAVRGSIFDLIDKLDMEIKRIIEENPFLVIYPTDASSGDKRHYDAVLTDLSKKDCRKKNLFGFDFSSYDDVFRIEAVSGVYIYAFNEGEPSDQIILRVFGEPEEEFLEGVNSKRECGLVEKLYLRERMVQVTDDVLINIEPYYKEAKKLVITRQNATVGLLREHFGINSERANDILAILEETGIIGPENDKKRKEIYFTPHPLFDKAKELVLQKHEASVPLLQKWLEISHNHAARLIDMLEEAGIVGPASRLNSMLNGSSREVLYEYDEPEGDSDE